MTNRYGILGVLTAGCMLAMALPQRATAAVDDNDFNALKDLVIKQGQRIDQLEKAHEQDQQALEQTKKLHQQDQQQIQELKQQAGETQKTASDAIAKADAAAAAKVPGPNATQKHT